jgi:hypothetical protein
MYGRDMILLQDRIAARDHGATPEEVERLAVGDGSSRTIAGRDA